jgi:hypothetical protein
MSCPSKITRPAVRVCRRVAQRASVDLPEPVSPTRPRVSPRRISRLTPSTAWTVSASRPGKEDPTADREVLDHAVQAEQDVARLADRLRHAAQFPLTQRFVTSKFSENGE